MGLGRRVGSEGERCMLRVGMTGVAYRPNATTPPSKILGGVEVSMEHETGLEPATPTLAISFSAIPSSSVDVHSRPDSRT